MASNESGGARREGYVDWNGLQAVVVLNMTAGVSGLVLVWRGWRERVPDFGACNVHYRLADMMLGVAYDWAEIR